MICLTHTYDSPDHASALSFYMISLISFQARPRIVRLVEVVYGGTIEKFP